jgi:hypothetical protein
MLARVSASIAGRLYAGTAIVISGRPGFRYGQAVALTVPSGVQALGIVGSVQNDGCAMAIVSESAGSFYKSHAPKGPLASSAPPAPAQKLHPEGRGAFTAHLNKVAYFFTMNVL